MLDSALHPSMHGVDLLQQQPSMGSTLQVGQRLPAGFQPG